MGEFLDLIPLITWCASLHMQIIQLLPLNDSGQDPSPYNPLSSCALNPLYISLSGLPYLSTTLKKKLPDLHRLTKEPKIPFQKILERKMEWLYDYYLENKEKILGTSPFEQFVKENDWLIPYSLYKGEAPFHQMLQFLAFEQMGQVKRFAGEHGIQLLGDIPILISGMSVDVQNHPEWFLTKFSAGAPPDLLNNEGQSWGFPLYNWEAMKGEGYSWWKIRLKTASKLYDLIRIDHIVGFFRIWAIAEGKSLREGKFIPEDESLWMDQGKERLRMLCEAAPLTLIGEDLGTVPPKAREVMAELGIYGTKVIRWERNWDTDRQFIPYSHYPPLSLTTLSTHDSETLTLWWKNVPQEAQAFAAFKNWTYDPILTPQQRLEILKDSHHTSSLLHINLLQEYLAFFPELVSPQPEEERINIPGKCDPNNWLYRYRPSLEEMTGHDKLKELMKTVTIEKIITNSFSLLL